ncbi:hypothetical protein AB1Y20_014627 [Prymnesium parvum]|uniref:Protein arginine N-methyltransferase n=1 Tax=Prymnesium parvum TaxID=97485 RepID=A0AB34ICU2_PRYPA
MQLLVLAHLLSGTTPPPLPKQTYFDEYASIYDHVGMLRDMQRMGAYHDAIRRNAGRHFRGKAVLDVGTGTGVLAIWAAQAGARKVYAVEATGVARHAEALVAAHGLQDVVTVLRGTMEEVELPERVDVILSEWMGYFLLRESMVQSVIYARDRWLKEGGAMYPGAARLMVHQLDDAPFVARRKAEIEETMEEWARLGDTLHERFDLDLSALQGAYAKEHFDWLYRTGWQGGVPSDVIVGEAHTLLEVDMATVSTEQLFGWSTTVSLPQITPDAPLSGLCVWFDVTFPVDSTCAGEEDPESPPPKDVVLSTSPLAPSTHWGSTALFLNPPSVQPELTIGLTQSLEDHHNLNVSLRYLQVDSQKAAEPTEAFYSISAEVKGYEL